MAKAEAKNGGQSLTKAFVDAVDTFWTIANDSNAKRGDLTEAADTVFIAGDELPMDKYNSLEADLVVSDMEEVRAFMDRIGVRMSRSPSLDDAGKRTFKP